MLELLHGQGYNILISLIASSTFIMPFIIAYNLLWGKIKIKRYNNIGNKILITILSVITGLAISMGGTLHYTIYGLLSNNSDYNYVKQRAYIGYDEGETSKVSTEIPAYANIVGDLHAYYMETIFSFIMIALLFQYFTDNKYKNNKIKLSSFINKYTILIPFLLAIQKITNLWSFLIFLVIALAVIIIKELFAGKINKEKIIIVIANIIEVILLQQLFALPFTMNLNSNISEVLFTSQSSPLLKWIVLWGFPLVMILAFVIANIVKLVKSKAKFKIFLKRHMTNIFIVIIGFASIGLIILPEIVYVKDIYGDEFQRFNTTFKLTYEAFIMFAISINYIIAKMILNKNKTIQILAIVPLIIQLSTLGYGFDGINYKYKNHEYLGISKVDNYFVINNMPGDYKLVQWINENVPKNDVILEASYINSSYSGYSRISAFTGNPTVIGWTTHEWIWRAEKDYSFPKDINARLNDVEKIYESSNVVEAKNLIKKYNIKYICVSNLEYETYKNINMNTLSALTKTVYRDDDNNTCVLEVEAGR